MNFPWKCFLLFPQTFPPLDHPWTVHTPIPDPTLSTTPLYSPGKVGEMREEIQPIIPEVSGLFCSRQGWSKERRDLPHPTKIFAMQHRASAI